MAKKLFRRFLPDAEKVRSHRHLRFLSRWFHDPNLWHLNRRSVAGGAAVGLFMAFLPMPLQMVPAVAVAILLRVNLPIAFAGVWITNTFTIAPISYFCYLVGTWVLQTPVQPIEFDITWEWLGTELARVWQPFLLGSLIVSTVSSVLGYFGVHALWRWHVIRDWERRKARRASRSA
jgi:hypothetical protein